MDGKECLDVEGSSGLLVQSVVSSGGCSTVGNTVLSESGSGGGLGESKVMKHLQRRLSKRASGEKAMVRLQDAMDAIGDASQPLDVDDLLAWCAVGAGVLKAVAGRMRVANPEAAASLDRAEALCDKVVFLNTLHAVPELEDMALEQDMGTQTDLDGRPVSAFNISQFDGSPTSNANASILLSPTMRERAVSGAGVKLRQTPSFTLRGAESPSGLRRQGSTLGGGGAKPLEGSIMFGSGGVSAGMASPPLSRNPSFNNLSINGSRSDVNPPLRSPSFGGANPGRIRPVSKKGSFVMKGAIDVSAGSPRANGGQKLAPLAFPLGPSHPQQRSLSPGLGSPEQAGSPRESPASPPLLGANLGSAPTPMPEVTLIAPVEGEGPEGSGNGVVLNRQGSAAAPAFPLPSVTSFSGMTDANASSPRKQGSKTGADMLSWRSLAPALEISGMSAPGSAAASPEASPTGRCGSPMAFGSAGGNLQLPGKGGLSRLPHVRSFSRPPKSHLQKEGGSPRSADGQQPLLGQKPHSPTGSKKLSVCSNVSALSEDAGTEPCEVVSFGQRAASFTYGDTFEDMFRDAFDDSTLHAFGEFLFPNPCDEGLVRYPIGEIHKYLGVFLLRSTGEICMWNPKMGEITGVDEGEACGSHITAFLLAYAEQEAVLYAMHDAIEFGDTRSVKVAMSCQDGANRCVVTLTLAASLHPPGQYIMAYCHERVPAEARLDCIIWSVKVLKQHLLELPEECEAARDSAAMKRVQEDVLKLERMCGRQRAKAWGTVALPQLFGKLNTHYAPEAEEKSVVMAFSDLDPALPNSVETDTEHLPQILGYLIHNAIRFTPEGGKVSVGVAKIDMNDNDEGNEQPAAAAAAEGDEAPASDCVICFTIEDSGPGVPEAVLQKLNDTVGQGLLDADADALNESTSSPNGGTESGFGLMMVSVLVAECGGSMEITHKHAGDEEAVLASAFAKTLGGKDEDKVKEITVSGVDIDVGEVGSTGSSGSLTAECTGTVIRIYLPLLSSDAAIEADEEAGDQDPPLDIRIKALVIQPNAVIRAALCQHLWGRKYAVSVASTPEEVGDFNVDVLLLGVDDKAGKGAALERLQASADIEKLDLILTVNQLVAHSDLEEIEASARGAGVHVLTLPLKPRELTRILKRVEKNVVEKKEHQERIDRIRAAFREDTANTPWERKKKLGTGAFGEVFQAINLVTNGVMAVKVVKNLGETEERALEVMNEVQLMSNLAHPNVIHYFHSQLEVDSDNERRLLIFMEFAGGGSLQEKVKKAGKMESERASGYVADILQGVGYLHSKNIIHRDIKTANILLAIHPDGREVCKVTDFGTAKKMEKKNDGEDVLATSMKGTPNFMAPEVMNEEPYDAKCDVWSIGCLVLELITGKLPFAHVSDKAWNVIRYICSLSPPKEADGEGFGTAPVTDVDYGPYTFPTDVKEFLGKTLLVDWSKRWGCEELRKTPFIESSDFMKLYRKVSMCKNKSANATSKSGKNKTKLTFGVKWDEEEGDNASTKDGKAAAAPGKKDDDSENFSGWGSDCSAPEVPADVWTAPSTPTGRDAEPGPQGPPAGQGRARASNVSAHGALVKRRSSRKSVAFADGYNPRQRTASRGSMRLGEGESFAIGQGHRTSRCASRGSVLGVGDLDQPDFARRRSSARPVSAASKRRQSVASAILQQKEDHRRKPSQSQPPPGPLGPPAPVTLLG